ncbi:hypothetical protein PTKIN_Ptkin14bG0128200 [Pterospermum kingtungense]
MRQPTRVGNHQWSRDEDKVLVDCLKVLVANPRWKANNGTFKTGYLTQLEKMMEFPNANLKAGSRIESRVKTLKKQCHAIAEMLSFRSGFRWNDVKTHPNAKGLRGKTFPFYDELGSVFGKDRATGAGAESATDAV